MVDIVLLSQLFKIFTENLPISIDEEGDKIDVHEIVYARLLELRNDIAPEDEEVVEKYLSLYDDGEDCVREIIKELVEEIYLSV